MTKENIALINAAEYLVGQISYAKCVLALAVDQFREIARDPDTYGNRLHGQIDTPKRETTNTITVNFKNMRQD